MTIVINSEIKNKLYLHKFQYKAVCKIKGAGYTYYVNDIETFMSRIERLKDLGKKTNKYGVRTIDDQWKEYFEEIDVDQISRFLTWRDTVQKEKCTIRIQNNTVSFFSNDLSLLKTLENIDTKLKLYKVQALDVETLYFAKEPRYKYRTFFKSKRVYEDFYKNVLEFVERYPNAKVSPGLIQYAIIRKTSYSKFMYMHGSYFIEYDDSSMVTILHMLFPGMMGKTYSLAKRP